MRKLRRRLLAGAAVLAATASPAWADRDPPEQIAALKAIVHDPGQHAYTGPLDINPSAWGWWGTRAASSADRGNPLINVCNVGDAACADMSSDATTGKLKLILIGGSDCTVVVCTIKIFRDRSGHGRDVTAASIGDRAVLLTNCQNSMPCAQRPSGASSVYDSGGVVGTSQPYTFYFLGFQKSGASTHGDIFQIGSTFLEYGYFNGANTIAFWCDTGIISSHANTDGVIHLFSAVYNGASSQQYIDTTGEGVVNQGNRATNTDIRLMAAAFQGNYYEGGLWPSDVSANIGTLKTNESSFWNF